MYAVIFSLLTIYSSPDSVLVSDLTAAIIEEAKSAEIDPVLVAKVVLVESRGREQAVNAVTHDYGIMQVNEKTAAALGISKACLMNWRCNIRVGVRLLASYDRPCRYNVGTGALVGRRLANCLTYDAALRKM